jgi:hypothetical protein
MAAFSPPPHAEFQIDGRIKQAFNFSRGRTFCRLIAEHFSGVARGVESLADRHRHGLLERTEDTPSRIRDRREGSARVGCNTSRRFRMEETPPAIKTRPLSEGANGP